MLPADRLQPPKRPALWTKRKIQASLKKPPIKPGLLPKLCRKMKLAAKSSLEKRVRPKRVSPEKKARKTASPPLKMKRRPHPPVEPRPRRPVADCAPAS